MKKLVVTFIVMSIYTLSLFSQLEKNTLLLGGYANFSYNSPGGTYLTFNPNSGLFLTNKFCLGISVPDK